MFDGVKWPRNRIRAFGFYACLPLCISAPSYADELPALSEAREVGRAKSMFLSDSGSRNTTKTSSKPDLAGFQTHLAPVFAKTCVACHGPKKVKGRFRVDQLNPDLLNGPDIDKWLEVFGVLSNSEMPPEDEPNYRLAEEARSEMIEWLGAEIKKAASARRHEGGHSSFRRMTRYEYNYALQDLLDLPHNEFAGFLPPETASEDGFKNSSELLQISAMQFETYRTIGLKALQKAAVSGERPEMVVYQLSMQDLMDRANSDGKKKSQGRVHLLDLNTGQSLKTGDPTPEKASALGPVPDKSSVVLILGGRQGLKMNLSNHLPDQGLMRVRARAGRATNEPNQDASLRLILSAHTSNNANFTQIVSKHDLPVTGVSDKPEFIDFFVPLGEVQRNPFRKSMERFPRRDEFLTIENIASGRKGLPGVYIDYIEIAAPYYEQWPPKSHRAIFIDSKNKQDETKYGREVLKAFMTRAWRKPVDASEVSLFMSLFATYRSQLPTFEVAMIEVLATVLAAPDFLYLTERTPAGSTGQLSNLELASRLSFFLWSSVPDEQLVALARQGKLKDSKVLAAEVKRMLADAKSKRFSQHFVKQWLGLDGLDSVAIDTHVHRDYSETLKGAMHQEPIAFFDDVLKRNGSVMDFIHSDYAVVNETLARHYRIPDVYGPHFRRVEIKPSANRGGILTAAAVMTMNSDGKDSHPLKRGIWLLKHILHDPPPPPPPNVPEVDLTDPKILQMTLKERIADHRDQSACRSCHAKIDPWGIAFENYDALGLYRTKIKDKPVDATSELFNQQELTGVDGLKRYLLAVRQDQFARAMVHKMTAYALGRPLIFGDRTEIERLTGAFRKGGDRLGDLVTLVVGSNLFQSRKVEGANPDRKAAPPVGEPKPAARVPSPKSSPKVETPEMARQRLKLARIYPNAGRNDLTKWESSRIFRRPRRR
jgi:hypothetical protein